MEKKRFVLLTLIVLAAAIVLPGAAEAKDIYKTDGNDTPGALDLASVRLSPIKNGDRFQVRTISPFTAAQLDGDDGWIVVDFDTNADRKANYSVFVYYYKGKLYAIQAKGSDFVRRLSVRRADPRTVSFDILHRNLGSVTSYDFAAFSVWRAAPCSQSKVCVDGIPNRYPLLRHDFTAPTVKWRNVPTISTEESDTSTFPVSFTVKDDRFGSGIKYWRLQSRTDAAPDWVTVKQARSATNTVQVDGAEGAVMQVRILALDRAGHRTVSAIRSTQVPFDDRNAALSYSASTQLARAGAYQGTISQIANAATVTLTHDFASSGAQGICVLLGRPEVGTTASATWTIDGTPQTPLQETDSTNDMTCATAAITSGTHTIVITGSSAEPFVLDGIAVAS